MTPPTHLQISVRCEKYKNITITLFDTIAIIQPGRRGHDPALQSQMIEPFLISMVLPNFVNRPGSQQVMKT